MARFSCTAILLALAGGFWPRPVAAQSLPPPPLATEVCLADETAALERALALELRRKMTAAARAGRTPPRFVLGCEGQLVLIRVFAGGSQRTLERTIDVLSTPPPARSRLMALAAAELGDSLWDGPEPLSATTAAAGPSSSAAAAVVAISPPSPTVSATLTATPATPTTRRLLYLTADVRAFRGAVGLLAGVGAGAAVRRPDGPGVTVDLVFNRAARQLALGRGTIEMLSSRPAATVSIDWHRWCFTAGGGVRLGVARVAGTPNVPDVMGATIWGMWGGPSLSASAGWSPFRRGTLTLMVEGGWTVAQVVGRQSGAPALSLSGPWTAVQLGAGWP